MYICKSFTKKLPSYIYLVPTGPVLILSLGEVKQIVIW